MRRTLPDASPEKRFGIALHSRLPPSSWELDSRRIIGHQGQGISGVRSEGGGGL